MWVISFDTYLLQNLDTGSQLVFCVPDGDNKQFRIEGWNPNQPENDPVVLVSFDVLSLAWQAWNALAVRLCWWQMAHINHWTRLPFPSLSDEELQMEEPKPPF